MPNTTTLSLGFSPCPNDCFIFDALVHGKIDSGGLKFEVVMDDVEALNRKALNAELDITKLSFHALAYLTPLYKLLNAGSALGFNCGPLLITKSEEIKNQIQQILQGSRGDVPDFSIAIPGRYTTANFLLSIALPQLQNKQEILFSNIEEAVLQGKADAGLIIHENRFTYEAKDLKKIIDLGEYWESLIQAPIPLGGIVIKRSLNEELQRRVDRLIRSSVEYAFEHPDSSMDYVRAHAQEMNEEVMKKHIQLYVNQYSVDLGTTGRKAVNLLFDKARSMQLTHNISTELFVEHQRV